MDLERNIPKPRRTITQSLVSLMLASHQYPDRSCTHSITQNTYSPQGNATTQDNRRPTSSSVRYGTLDQPSQPFPRVLSKTCGSQLGLEWVSCPVGEFGAYQYACEGNKGEKKERDEWLTMKIRIIESCAMSLRIPYFRKRGKKHSKRRAAQPL